MMTSSKPGRAAKFVRVEPFKVMNRLGDGSFTEVTGMPFGWAGNSYRRTTIEFDQPVNRVIVHFILGGAAWPHPCQAWGLAVNNDFRDAGSVVTFPVPFKAGVLTLNSGAPGPSSWANFPDVYGEVAA